MQHTITTQSSKSQLVSAPAAPQGYYHFQMGTPLALFCMWIRRAPGIYPDGVGGSYIYASR